MDIQMELKRVLEEYAKPDPETGWIGDDILLDNAEEAAAFIIENANLNIREA
jgi:hypothetical protein